MKRGAEGSPSAFTGTHERGDQRTQEKRVKQQLLTDKLYFNKVTVLNKRHNANAFSLSELLEIIAPTASIHLNYMIDLRWLLAQYPEHLRNLPVTLIVGERMGTDFTQMRSAVKQCVATNVSVGRARLVIPFGTHHSKISIFESNHGRLHIIISTANLLEHDWEFKTQAFYHCSGTELPSEDDPDRKISDFQADLVKYLEEYKSSQDWNLIEYWRDRVARVDLSHVKARVIYSVPGPHREEKLTQYGHPRLRILIKELFGKAKKEDFTYHAQFSSFGSLGPTPEHWLTGQFLSSLAGGAEPDGSHLRIIYPCVEDVRNSNEGYEAGGSLPYSSNIAKKQQHYLTKFMHKWRSDRLGRTHAMPHIKTYAAFDKNSLKPCWLVITSANLSKAAWGEYQLKGTQLAIRSYEFGLLFTDPESLDMLPYDMPLTEYKDTDRVWLIDRSYKEPDAFQKTWPMAKSEKSLLSFGDTVLYEADLRALEGGRWLTDPIISFALEYFHEKTLDDSDKEKICFVNAAVCQLIKLSSRKDAVQILDELTLKEKEHVIFVVNDHNDPSSGGGSHWSLLIYRRDHHPHFLVIDSAQGTSGTREATDKLIQILAKYLKLKNDDSRIENATKQFNSMDCGMFVIEFTRLYIESVKKGDANVDFTQLNAEDVKKQRKVWGLLIRSLAEEE